ncbi:MAG: PAS domain-containing protein [Bdellovibrionales bacterium]|nr:PAS domain-containing protein [Bdellovibrionales bacterium]
MRKPSPINRESPFEIEELFFSKTDLRGLILSGNSVFVRVSKYSAEELKGVPHSVVRHPDMPRIVFKLLWDTIGARKPIAAYVKNLSKDGSYYWVFALVLPVEGGYLSLRLKPTTAVFEKVISLYSETLVVEKFEGLDAALSLVMSSLNSLGFSTYQEFMTAALTAELQARDQAILSQSKRGNPRKAKNALLSEMSSIQEAFGAVFLNLVGLTVYGAEIRSATLKLLSSLSSFGRLSINMAIGADRLGSQGMTMAEVSRGLQRQATLVQEKGELFQKSLKAVMDEVNKSLLEIGAGKLGVEMLHFFILETAQRAEVEEDDFSADIPQNYKLLLQLLSESRSRTLNELELVRKNLLGFQSHARELMEVGAGLEVIRVAGKIEIASLAADQAEDFYSQLERMSAFLEELTSSLKKVLDSAKRGLSEVDVARAQLGGVLAEIQGLENRL